jgi:hypothetical protein
MERIWTEMQLYEIMCGSDEFMWSHGQQLYVMTPYYLAALVV